MAQKQDINFPVVSLIAVVSVMLLAVVFFGAQAWYAYEEQAEIRAKVYANPAVIRGLLTAGDLRDQQLAGVSGYKPVDGQPGVYHIPLGDAMKAIVHTGGKLPSTRPAQ
jgi:hypothetical protein